MLFTLLLAYYIGMEADWTLQSAFLSTTLGSRPRPGQIRVCIGYVVSLCDFSMDATVSQLGFMCIGACIGKALTHMSIRSIIG